MNLRDALSYTYDIKVANTYILTLPTSKQSVRMTKRCVESCEKVGQKHELWEGFDGLGEGIVAPKHLEKEPWLKWIKCPNSALKNGEVAAFLGHVSLWAKCIELDRPIVILEHDAVMAKKFEEHPCLNAIIYLGCEEQQEGKLQVMPVPVHLKWQGLNCLYKAHAYSVDPFIARRLMGSVVSGGITRSIDVFMRADVYTQVQIGLFAYDISEGSTIVNRDKTEEEIRICSKVY
jgi:hypothetical protein